MAEEEISIEQVRMLVARLERISVDSIWARRSSGLRGALLRWAEHEHQNPPKFSEDEIQTLQNQLRLGFEYLEKAARERFP